MDTNQHSDQQPPGYLPPTLHIEPTQLNYGVYNPNLPLIQQPVIQLVIQNTGGGRLIGRLVPQVSWLVINVLDFDLQAGESSQHAVQLSTGAPQQINQPRHQFKDVLILTSSAGPVGLDVSYRLDYSQKPYTPMRMDLTPRPGKKSVVTLLSLAALVVALLLAVIGFRYLGNSSKQSEGLSRTREQLLTQGAQTVLAASGLVTDTPVPDAAIVRPNTPTTMSLFSPLTTDTPDLAATANQPTFTPWATDQFLNPELIITGYFAALTDGNFQQAWNYLTREYQVECCTALGTDPYYIFVRDWSAVTDIKLVSAYLQEYGVNPAPVLVRYQYRNTENALQEFTHMYWLVVNEDQTSLVINAVDKLQED